MTPRRFLVSASHDGRVRFWPVEVQSAALPARDVPDAARLEAERRARERGEAIPDYAHMTIQEV